jgi:hypothetical protein
MVTKRAGLVWGTHPFTTFQVSSLVRGRLPTRRVACVAGSAPVPRRAVVRLLDPRARQREGIRSGGHGWRSTATSRGRRKRTRAMTGLAPAAGSASLYNVAVGASVVLLTLVVMRSPGRLRARLRLRWRPVGVWERLTRLGEVLAGVRGNSRSRIRTRIDLLLVRLLGDEADEQPESRPRGKRSKHRLSGPPKDSQNSKPAPRHAAPPAG